MPVAIAYTLAPGARAPTRATPGAAGMDLYAYLPDGARAVIQPGDSVRVDTGLHLALPPGYEGQIRPRSGLAWNHGLTVLNSPGTIDSDYRGEVRVILINHGTRDVIINHGDRIAQLVVCPAPAVALTAADALPPTQRGAGGFGSTGTGPVAADAWKHDSGATVTASAPASAPVTLTRRSPDAARAYHEGYAAGLSSMAGWLREKADSSEAMAATLGAGAELPADGGSDDDRARLEARVRALEAEVLEARAEAVKWAAELDRLRAGGAQ